MPNTSTTPTWILDVTNAVVVEIAKWAVVFAIDAVVVAVVEAVFTCFVVVAGAVLVHIQAVVFIVTNAVRIRVGIAVTTANANGVQLGAVAITGTGWDGGTSTFVNGARAIANAALVKLPNTVVYVVTNAIGISVCSTSSAAFAQRVKHVAVAITSAFGNAVAATHAALVEHVAVTVASTFSDAFATAHTALVEHVAVTVASTFSDAIATAHTALVKHVAFAVASTFSDAIATAHAALVEHVAFAVASTFSDAFATAHAALVEHVAFAVASAFSDSSPPHTPHSSSTLPSQSQAPSAMPIATADAHRPSTSKNRRRCRLLHHSCKPSHRCSRELLLHKIHRRTTLQDRLLASSSVQPPHSPVWQMGNTSRNSSPWSPSTKT